MSYLLNINTALEIASISLSREGEIIAEKQNSHQKDHASFLHPAILEVLKKADLTIKNLSAVSIIAGPGSYTGLRVGMSAAKGICFALNLPLITVNTLEWMASSASNEETELFCPMIDARRMEVYTALYSKNLEEITPPTALILQTDSFSERLKTNKILFFGNGAKKCLTLISHPNAAFKIIEPLTEKFTEISWNRYQKGIFANLAYVEPLYIKDFYTANKA
jgi:tRNA threonylcarbamoyladenosine biosynthesis protein TsaB